MIHEARRTLIGLTETMEDTAMALLATTHRSALFG
jgi:hypothetical protein